jgi:hypothetical protein
MKKKKKAAIPSFIRPFLWSYDTKAMNLQKDRKRIITNVLNLGTKKATRWALSTYPKTAVKAAVRKPLPGEWSDKSLHFWSTVLNVAPRGIHRHLK